MFYLITQSTHFIYSYMADYKMKPGLLFPVSSKGSFTFTKEITQYITPYMEH